MKPLKCDYWADSLIDGQTDARHMLDKVILKRRRMKLCHPRKTRFSIEQICISLQTTGRYIVYYADSNGFFSAGPNVNGCCSTVQRVRHANRGRLLLRTPGPVPLWDLHVF